MDICAEIKRRFSPSKAIRAQRFIARSVVLRDEYPPLRVVAGLDVAYKRLGGLPVGIGVAVALRYPSMKPLECIAYLGIVCIPYIPGLLAFREMAVLAPALAKLRRFIKPDLLVLDGHGIAHPRRAGIASHVGVAFNMASIGVAKKRLFGREESEGGREYLVDEEGRRIAVIIRRGKSRIYVSPGHKVSLESSAKLVRSMLVRSKLPEPTRIADHISKRLKSQLAGIEGLPRYIRCSGSTLGSISYL